MNTQLSNNANIAKSNSDYPVRNPAPAVLIPLVVRMPATLSADFYVHYTAVMTRGANGDLSCGLRPTVATIASFAVFEPITGQRDGDTLRADIVADRYLPGRCQWHFDGIDWRVANGTDSLGSAMFAVVYDARRDLNSLDKLPKGPAYLVCKRDPDPANAKHSEKCATLKVIQMVSDVSPNLVEQLPAAARGNPDVTWIMPDTRKIELDFYDLDAMELANKSSDGPSAQR